MGSICTGSRERAGRVHSRAETPGVAVRAGFRPIPPILPNRAMRLRAPHPVRIPSLARGTFLIFTHLAVLSVFGGASAAGPSVPPKTWSK